MATYKGIKGVKVVTKTTDPTASEAVGTVWYNSTSPVALKYAINAGGAWSSGSDLNNGRRNAGGAGITTAAIIAGGMPTTGGVGEVNCETYDGTSWSEVNNLTAGRNTPVTFGTTTAAVTATGNSNTTNATYDLAEVWNGTCWSAVNPLNQTRSYASTANQGTTTAGLVFSGTTFPVSVLLSNESYDGTSWSEENNVLVGRGMAGGGGTSTAAFMAAGETTPSGGYQLMEIWDGTCWTEVNNVHTGRFAPGSSGTVTTALIFGGTTGPTQQAVTEQWDGTSWTEVGDLATARERPAKGLGLSGTTALCAGGALPATPTPTAYRLTEEWAEPVYTIKTVTVS